MGLLEVDLSTVEPIYLSRLEELEGVPTNLEGILSLCIDIALDEEDALDLFKVYYLYKVSETMETPYYDEEVFDLYINSTLDFNNFYFFKLREELASELSLEEELAFGRVAKMLRFTELDGKRFKEKEFEDFVTAYQYKQYLDNY